MRNKFTVAIALLTAAFFSTTAKAQPDSLLRIYADNYQEERVFIHFDKASYLPGETIWFKAYLMAGIELSNNSKNFYVECADETGKVLQHITAPIVLSSAKGRFDIPNTYKGSTLHIKAYTKWMLNFDTAFVYHKSIPIFQNTQSAPTQKPVASLLFFPEGGDMVNALQNRIAFKAATPSGMPVSVKGAILNSAGKLVDSFVSRHDGLGSFLFTPKKGETYTASWKDEWQITHTTPLPTAKNQGVAIKAYERDNQLRVHVDRSEDAAENLKLLRIVATMHKQVVYRSNAKMQNVSTVEGVIPLAELPAGVLQVTVFDINWMPIAERVFFVKGQDYELLADARIFKPNLAPKAKNVLEINIPDEIATNLSVAVTDADVNPSNEENIISGLLLTSDIKGYVHNPKFYFANDMDSTKEYLDLVMLTHGWRRIKWQAIAQNELPVITYPKDSIYLSLAGNVFNAKPAQLREAGDINIIVRTKDSATRFLSLPLNSDGSFISNNFLFFDTVTVFYQFNKKKDLVNSAAVTFNNTLLTAPQKLLLDSSYKVFGSVDTTGLQKRKNFMAYQASLDKLLATTTLQGVTVTTKQKKPVDELEDKYVTGMFKGDGYQFDMLNDPLAIGSLDIFTYLRGRVAGLTITNSGPTPSATWRGSATSFFLDEMPVDAGQIQNIPLTDVAYVKVLRPPFFGAVGGGAGGAIAVYTRRGGDVKSTPGKGLDNKKVAGYTFMKEFYAPDYEITPDKKYDADIRTTLYWNPYVLTEKKTRTVQLTFFNSDATKKFRIDIQGVNTEGKLVSIEKVIQ